MQKMNRGGEKQKLKNGGKASKKRGMARGCGKATKGKGYNKQWLRKKDQTAKHAGKDTSKWALK